MANASRKLIERPRHPPAPQRSKSAGSCHTFAHPRSPARAPSRAGAESREPRRRARTRRARATRSRSRLERGCVRVGRTSAPRTERVRVAPGVRLSRRAGGACRTPGATRARSVRAREPADEAHAHAGPRRGGSRPPHKPQGKSHKTDRARAPPLHLARAPSRAGAESPGHTARAWTPDQARLYAVKVKHSFRRSAASPRAPAVAESPA